MAFGGAAFTGNSKLFIGPLGVVQVGFKGYDLGKTTADTTLVPDQDIKDINYQQDGTKPADYVKTGIQYILNAVFGEISTGLVKLLMGGIESSEPAADDGGVISRSVFKSMLNNEAGVLRVAAIDEHGVPLADYEHILNFYHVIPIISGDLINWGVDTQRNLPVEFRIKYHTFTVGELGDLDRSDGGAFGYWGDPDVEDVTPIVWPDVEGPRIVSAICDDATSLFVTFHEVIAFQNGFEAVHYNLKLNGDYEAPTGAAVIEGNGNVTLDITITGPFTGPTDVVEISISEDALEDAAANAFAGVDSFPCVPWVGP